MYVTAELAILINSRLMYETKITNGLSKKKEKTTQTYLLSYKA